MSGLSPISHRELVSRLSRAGFEGPFRGGKHRFMVREKRRVVLPNPHGEVIRVDLLVRILRQAGITHEEWESLS